MIGVPLTRQYRLFKNEPDNEISASIALKEIFMQISHDTYLHPYYTATVYLHP